MASDDVYPQDHIIGKGDIITELTQINNITTFTEINNINPISILNIITTFI